VLPCCVFPSLFPHRSTPSPTPTPTGSHTHTHNKGEKKVKDKSDDRESHQQHAQFCRYLASKDPRICVTALPIRGRNIVVFAHLTKPSSAPTTSISIPSSA
jgi:hypothetical protein